ncbi:MAG TPA: hypothetical protein VFE50_26205 [Cyclobacteriaceae bacterium]|nr:hypothetical protein [Cyclobacteriaceae bacterium]
MRIKESLVVPGTALIFFAASFIFRLLSFLQTPFANGWDGYFYINQVRSFMEEGRMDVPDISLIYPLMMVVQVFTGDYVLSYKLLAAILAATLTMSFFLLALKWTDNYKTALILGSMGLFSPHLTYFAAQYPKNLLGVVLFIWLLYASDSKRKVVIVLMMILNFVGHRVTAVLGLLYLVIRGFSPYVVIIIGAAIMAAGFFLPGILNLFDVERFHGVISTGLQFTPYSFIKSFGFDLIGPWWLIEIVAACIVFFAAIVYAVKKPDRRLTSILFVLAVLIFPFFVWSENGPAIRFFLIFILLCPLLLIFFLRSIEKNYLAFVLITCSFFSYRTYDPAKHDPNYELYCLVATQAVSKVRADSIELIIAHKALAEYIVYSTGIDAMSWIPEYEIDKARLWRIAEGVKDVQFNCYLDPDDMAFVHRITPTYCLIREDYWTKFLLRIKNDSNEELLNDLTNWKNPSKMRPKFLLKNKS